MACQLAYAFPLILYLFSQVKLSRDGAGPRHIAVSGGRAFCVCELDNTVVAFDVDEATGVLTETGWVGAQRSNVLILDSDRITPTLSTLASIHVTP